MKKSSIVWKILFILLAAAAAVTIIMMYKNEILDAVDALREKIICLKRRHIIGKEFEDYEDDIL